MYKVAKYLPFYKWNSIVVKHEITVTLLYVTFFENICKECTILGLLSVPSDVEIFAHIGKNVVLAFALFFKSVSDTEKKRETH